MKCSLDRMFDYLHVSLSREFPNYLYHLKVSEVRKSFYAQIRKKRGKILGDSRKELFEDVKNITENVYNNYARSCNKITFNYFLYYKLIRNYGNFHFHFLVIRN